LDFRFWIEDDYQSAPCHPFFLFNPKSKIENKKSESRRIKPTRIKRVAAANAPGTFDCSTHETIFLDGLDVVVATGWRESALASDDRAESALIDADQRDRSPRGQVP
jgi:hypothetical protein